MNFSIEPRQELWKKVELSVREEGTTFQGTPYEILSPIEPSPEFDLESALLKFRGGKGRWKKGGKHSVTW